MSGTIGSNILSHSGTVAETAAGLNWVSDVVTASTVTVESGNGYWINTTSNACTITLPASAEAGDQIIIVDFARTWGTNNVTLDSNGLNFQGNSDVYENTYSTSGQSVNLIYSDSTKGWIPLEDDVTADEPVAPVTQKGLFAFGSTGDLQNVKNLVNSSGVVASDATGVGTARVDLAGASYGEDKGIFYGGLDSSARTNVSNLVNNSGVIASDTTGVGTARANLKGASYSTNKAIFAFGTTSSADTGVSNLVSSSGVIATDTSAVGSARNNPGAAEYGNTLAIYAFGGGPLMNTRNLVSDLGVIASDATGVGTARSSPAGVNYGGDKAIFVFGYLGSDNIADLSNLVSNTGVVASDTTGVGTHRTDLDGCGYGGDKGIVAFGNSNTGSTTPTNLSNKISSSGVIASDTSGVGESRYNLAATGYSQSA